MVELYEGNEQGDYWGGGCSLSGVSDGEAGVLLFRLTFYLVNLLI